jgi:hypothetical protein
MTIYIKLDSEHSITSDSKQFILNKNERAITFFPELEDLLKSYLEMKIRGSNSHRLEDLRNYLKQQKKAIVEAVNTSQQQLKQLMEDVR